MHSYKGGFHIDFLWLVLLLTGSMAPAAEYDFKTFTLEINKHSGSVTVARNRVVLFNAMLFLNADAKAAKATRYFQDSNHVKKPPVPAIRRQGDQVVVSLAGVMSNPGVGYDAHFTQTARIGPDGGLNLEYTVKLPAEARLREIPRLIVSMPMTTVRGRGLCCSRDLRTEWKVISRTYSRHTRLSAANLTDLKVATEFGPVAFSSSTARLGFHDTRAYSKPGKGALRIACPGSGGSGAWRISLAVRLPVTKAGVPPVLLEQEVAAYQPDFGTWDIYQPFVRRTHLSGWWKLKRLQGTAANPSDDPGTTAKYFAPDLDDTAWENFMVPHDWNMRFPVTLNRCKPDKRRLFSGVGWYRLKFKAPANPGGLRAMLHFDDIAREAVIYLNGKRIGSHLNYRLDGMRVTREDFALDVSNAIRYGALNTLAVRVYHSGEPVRWGSSSPGGILGRVYLDLKPGIRCERIMVTPHENLRGLRYDCLLAPSPDPVAGPDWRVEVFEWNSRRVVARSRVRAAQERDGRRFISGSLRLRRARAWSCESPFLYGIRFIDASGNLTGIRRFGLRTFHARNGQFLLNGKPVMLRGVVLSEKDFTKFRGYLFAQNEGDSLRRFFKRLRTANINHIRFHTSILPEIAYDILDELGFLITDEINYPNKAIRDPANPDKIKIEGIDYACKKDGSLLPRFVQRVKHRMYSLYSHPCIATFSFGNEMRELGQCRALFNNLYTLYKQLDRQDRPITPSSGRIWKNGSNMAITQKEKFDYIDTHDYTGSINNWPVAFCQPVAEHFIRTARPFFPKGIPPIVNGETVYFAPHYYPQFYDNIWKTESDPTPNWKKYLWALTEMGKTHPDHKKMSYYWVRNWGTRGYKYHRAEGRGWYAERILDVQRKLWPDLDGFEALIGDFFDWKLVFPLAATRFAPNAAYEPMRQVCAPVVVVLDDIAPNRYAGDEIRTNATIINNSESALPALTLKLAARCGKDVLWKQGVNLGAFAIGEKKVVPCRVPIAANLRNAVVCLEYGLVNNDTMYCDRSMKFNVRCREQVFAPIDTRKRVMLYDGVERVFTGMGRPSTTRLVQAYGLRTIRINDFNQLEDCDLLIIGADSLDNRVNPAGRKIRAFVEAGGRLLVFEQQFQGRMPFLRELEYVKAGAGQFAETVQQYHPVLRGMRQKEFLCWNRPDRAIYHTHIRPLSEAAVLVGGDTTTWGSDNFGMVVAHAKLGRGTVIFCQAEVTGIFQIDAGAGMLAGNLLRAALNDRAASQAGVIRGRPVILRELTRERACFISLAKAANMGFADKVPHDGKGGWTDQGPKNDLAALIPGLRIFAGIPFNIQDPAANKGRSCIVVSANPKLAFKPVSAAVSIGRRLKRLVFLHASAWTPKKGVAGKYTVTFASGKIIEIPLVVGRNMADWWNAPGKNLTRGECVWSTTNGSSVVGVFAYSWKNPRPDDPVASLQVQSLGNAVIGLFALTGEK